MPKIVLYIATSLDGFIAKPDGNIDWLNAVPEPESGDYGYAELLKSISTIIMGRKTYDEVRGFGIEWPYKGYDTYVVTRNKDLEIWSPDTYAVTGNVKDFVAGLLNNTHKDIWLVGGGHLNTEFLKHGLIDKMIISVIPKIIGDGIPLFAPTPPDSDWKLVETRPFNTGVVNLVYERI